MGSFRATVLPLSACALLALTANAPISAQTDRETVEAMQTKASLACPGYSTDRANAAIAGISVDTLRVLAKHNVVLCPDRRLSGEQAVIWYPNAGALTWNAASSAAVAALSQVAGKLTKTEDFPEGLTVWNAKGEPLKNQITPAFSFKPTYRP